MDDPLTMGRYVTAPELRLLTLAQQLADAVLALNDIHDAAPDVYSPDLRNALQAEERASSAYRAAREAQQ